MFGIAMETSFALPMLLLLRMSRACELDLPASASREHVERVN